MRFKVALLLILVGVAAGALQAQTPDEVRALLESPVPKDQAWGAWHAAQGKMRQLEPQLRKNLEAHLNTISFQDEIVLDTTLDAFIQFGEDALPIDLVQAIYARRHAQGLILLSEAGRPQAAVDHFMRTILEKHSETAAGQQGFEWFAAADLLLSHRATGLVASVLRDLRITGDVVICDSETNCATKRLPYGIGGSIPSGGPYPGYPPWPKYGVVNPGPDATVFIQGPTPLTTMAYRRHVESDPTATFSSVSESARRPPTTTERMTYVAAASPQLRIPSLEGDTLKFIWRNNPDAYDEALTTFKQSIVERYSTMIRQLRAAGILTATEATALEIPFLDIRIDDKRKR